MIGFVISDPNQRRTKIQFIYEHWTYTLVLPKLMAIDRQVFFYRWFFVDPVKPWRCTIGSVRPVNGIIMDVSGDRLLLTTVLTYPADSVCSYHLLKIQHCVCIIIKGIICLWLPTHLPIQPPHPILPSILLSTPYNVPSMILQFL